MRNHTQFVLRMGAAAVLAAVSAATWAGTATGTLSVSANVLSVCLISGGTLSFGNYDPTSGTALDASTTLTLTCTPGASYAIAMDAGGGSGATTSVRKMTKGSNTLDYAIYRDSARTQTWGNSAGTDTLSGTASTSSLTNTVNVYGRVPVNQVVPAGTNYGDAVTVTVSY